MLIYFLQDFYDEIADQIFKLREQREKCTVDTATRDAQIARINELQDFIKQQPAHLKAFDEALVKRWLERIIVWENHFTVEATVDLSSNFYGWVFSSGGKMKITAPQEAVDGFQRMLEINSNPPVKTSHLKGGQA